MRERRAFVISGAVKPTLDRSSPARWRVGLLMGAMLISVGQQVPPLRDSVYQELRMLILGLFAVLVISSFRPRCLFGLPRLMVSGVTISGVMLLIVGLLASTQPSAALLVDAAIAVGILLVSSSTLVGNSLRPFLAVWVALSVIMAFWTLIADNGGFGIADQYLVQSKNQIGPIVGSAAIVCMHRLLESRRVLRPSVSYLAVTWIVLAALTVLIGSLIAIRNRAGLVAFLAIALVYVSWYLGGRLPSSRLPVLLLAAWIMAVLYVVGALGSVSNYVQAAFTANYDSRDLNSLSAGRVDGYLQALASIRENPFFGGMVDAADIGSIPHNYVLRVLVSLGVLVGLPLLFVYLKLWVGALQGVLTWRGSRVWAAKYDSRARLSCVLLLFSLVISLFEYSAPYGPGTAMALTWFMLGQGFGRDGCELPPAWGQPRKRVQGGL